MYLYVSRHWVPTHFGIKSAGCVSKQVKETSNGLLPFFPSCNGTNSFVKHVTCGSFSTFIQSVHGLSCVPQLNLLKVEIAKTCHFVSWRGNKSDVAHLFPSVTLSHELLIYWPICVLLNQDVTVTRLEPKPNWNWPPCSSHIMMQYLGMPLVRCIFTTFTLWLLVLQTFKVNIFESHEPYTSLSVCLVYFDRVYFVNLLICNHFKKTCLILKDYVL